MTRESDTDDLKNNQPVISIQSDWDDVIFSTNQEVWISCKFIGKEGVHSKLRSHGINVPSCTTSDFSVKSLSKNALEVVYNPTGHVVAFIPPVKTFSKIHQKRILSLNVTNEGLGVSACAENKLIVWSLTTGEVMRTLTGHVGSVYKCKFFPSGIVVLSGGADMQLKIWSAETGECPVTLIGHKAAINDFCMVDRGRNIISVSKDGTAKLWDCGKSACLATIFESTEVLNCCTIGILPDYFKIVRKEPVSDREIGTENKLLIIGTEEGFVHGVAVFSRETVFKIKTDSAVNLVLILIDQIIIGCQNGKIEIYKFSDLNKPVKTICESASPVLSGCVYKESGVFVGRNDGTVLYYDCLTFSDKRISLTGSDCDPIYDLSCSNNKIVTGCRDSKIRLYALGDSVSTFI